MKHLIKKILKENDFEWANNINPLETYINWLKENHQNVRWVEGSDRPRIAPDFIESVQYSIGSLVGDCEEMVEAAKLASNKLESLEDRRTDIQIVEDYSSVGYNIEYANIYMDIIVEYAEQSGIEEDEVLRMFKSLSNG